MMIASPTRDSIADDGFEFQSGPSGDVDFLFPSNSVKNIGPMGNCESRFSIHQPILWLDALKVFQIHVFYSVQMYWILIKILCRRGLFLFTLVYCVYKNKIANQRQKVISLPICCPSPLTSDFPMPPFGGGGGGQWYFRERERDERERKLLCLRSRERERERKFLKERE